MTKADYSEIASYYDTARPLSEQNLEQWLVIISRLSSAPAGARVLDLGCGTGRFALPMAGRLGFHVIGGDASPEMLARAAEKDAAGRVHWACSDAQRLAFADASFDVVLMSHLLHHVDRPQAVIAECHRVLAYHGPILVRYGAIEQIRDDPIHTFFPEALAIDEARTPSVTTVEQWLRNAGFEGVVSQEVVQQTFERGADQVRMARDKSTSVLTLIPPEAYEVGLAALARHVEQNPDDPWLLRDRLTITAGWKPTHP